MSIIFIVVGIPYFFIQGILAAFITAGVQTHLSWKLRKFPWEISIADAANYLDKGK